MRSSIVRTGLTVIAWSAACGAPAIAHADKSIAERLDANPRASVEINNVAGSVYLQGWDKPQVEVVGTSGGDVERVAVTGDPTHIVVQVITRQDRLWGADNSAQLVVHVPAKSSVSVTAVSADLKVAGLLGDLKLQSVSGMMQGDVGGNLHAGSVSGDIHLKAPGAKSIEVKTVSGDITLTGGSGETEVTTISGTVKVDEGMQTRVHFKSVSGNVTASLAVSPDAQVDGQSVSGDISLKFAAVPTANFDVQTFSGEIQNCFGPKPVAPQHGSGSRLEFKNGEGSAHIQISSKSGDVKLCTDQAPAAKPSA